MRRRSVLAAGVALFAGCSTFSGNENADDRSTTPQSTGNTPTPTSENTTEQELNQSSDDDDIWHEFDSVALPDTRTVVDFDTVPLSATAVGEVQTTDGLAVEMDMISGATVDSPATLTVVVKNRLSYKQTIRPYRLVVMDNPPVGWSVEQNTIYLAPTEDHPFVETVPEYERDDEGRWRVATLAEDWFPKTLTLPPERAFTAEYYVFAPPVRDKSPVEPGRYQFPPGSYTGFELVVWPTDEPGPQGRSQFEDVNPPYLVGAERMAWFHNASPGTTRYVQPATETVELPGTIKFELRNRSAEPMLGNPRYWRVHKLVEGEWFPIAPWQWPQPATVLGPGERDQSTLALFHGEPIDIEARTVGYIGGGTYAYELRFSTEEPRTHAAMFEVEAPDVTLDIEERATVTEDGLTTVVTMPNHADASRPATAVVTPTDETPDKRLLPEQLPRRRFRVLWNSLPLFTAKDSREEIYVRTDQATVREVLDDADDESVFEYRNMTYRVTASMT